ncbi:MAG: cytidine deaminase [Armatimonadota bacterium]|nr:cytidine deaminase [Armatimonadota bacterium]
MKDELYKLASEVRKFAHARYSNYKVGAALLSEGQRTFVGCNVENAVYPLGQCAERVAVQAMIAGGAKQIESLMVVTENGAAPCGACCQVIAEFAEPSVTIYIADENGNIREATLGVLLPDAFTLEERP